MKHVWLLRALIIALIVVTLYALQSLQKTSAIYEEVSSSLAKEPAAVARATLGENTIKIPTYELFKPGGLWALVSRDKPLSKEADYDLVDIPVDHGDRQIKMKVAKETSDELQQLVNAAEADNEPLMVSSAYRSLDEQKELYENFVTKNGASAAKQYVLPVGASEHHTGLTVDFSSVSDDCADDSDTCSLSESSAAWLATNAPKYGFILRYPEAKQSITGVRFEPWHYRFVGRPLAKAMAATDLTYEEVVEQLAPGYSVVK